MRKERCQLPVGKCRGHGEQARQDPREQQTAGGTGLTRNVGRHDENSGADHGADPDHGAVEEPAGTNETNRLLRGDWLVDGLRGAPHSLKPHTPAPCFAPPNLPPTPPAHPSHSSPPNTPP